MPQKSLSFHERDFYPTLSHKRVNLTYHQPEQHRVVVVFDRTVVKVVVVIMSSSSSSFVRRGRRFRRRDFDDFDDDFDDDDARNRTRDDDVDVDDFPGEKEEKNGRVKPTTTTTPKTAERRRRAQKADAGEGVPKTMTRGTRPGPRGDQRLVSLGNGDLDDILGGGVPLNACFGIFLADDDESLASPAGAIANLLSRLFLSEGAVATAQDGMWLTTDDFWTHHQEKKGGGRDARETLPRLIMDETQTKRDDDERDIIDDDADEKATTRSSGAGGDGLKIAWQYRRYLEQNKRESAENRSGTRASTKAESKKKKPRAFCHDFDVTRAYSNEEAKGIPIDVVHCDVSQENVGATFEAVKKFGNKLVEKDIVGRIVIEPPRALLDDPSNATVFKRYLALLHAVKGFMQRSDMEHRLVLFVLFPSKRSLSKTKLNDLRQTCDCYVETASLLNPECGFDLRATGIESVLPEPTINCVALLSLGKKRFPGALAGGFGTVDSTFAIQRRGKRYGIKPLAQRPEDHDNNGEKKMSGSGGLCNSGPSGGKGSLDF